MGNNETLPFTPEREAQIRRYAADWKVQLGELNWPALLRELLAEIDKQRGRVEILESLLDEALHDQDRA